MNVFIGSYIWEKTIIFTYIPTEGHMFLRRNHHYLHWMTRIWQRLALFSLSPGSDIRPHSHSKISSFFPNFEKKIPKLKLPSCFDFFISNFQFSYLQHVVSTQWKYVNITSISLSIITYVTITKTEYLIITVNFRHQPLPKECNTKACD